MRKAMWMLVLALPLLGFLTAAVAQADDHNKKTVLTFSQPVEVPGHVLPAGTYTFMLADTMSDRHIVQIFSADGSHLIATVMAVPDYRLATTQETVIKFGEAPRGSPETIRAWFYPNSRVGQEFVYAKPRAMELAKASNTVVPAITAEVADVDAMKTAPIVAITPDARELPVMTAIQTTPGAPVAADAAIPGTASSATADGSGATTQLAQRVRNGRHLPQTASNLPLLIVFGLGSVAIAFGLLKVVSRATAPAL
jgi:hypothetical protein